MKTKKYVTQKTEYSADVDWNDVVSYMEKLFGISKISGQWKLELNVSDRQILVASSAEPGIGLVLTLTTQEWERR